MGTAGNLNFVVDVDNVWLVNEAAQPLLNKSGVPGSVGAGGIWWRADPRTVGQETVSGISLVGVEFRLVWKAF